MSGNSLADRLAVCSWSLQPASPAELIGCLKKIGINKVQLALCPLVTDPAWADAGAQLAGAGVGIVSGMFGTKGEDYSTLDAIKATGGIVPDETWDDNWAHIQKVIPMAVSLGVKFVTFHAGFLPEDPADGSYQKLTGRLSQIASAFAEAGLDLGLETGQEDAETLKGFLDSLAAPNLGVNFDPANMILYGKGEPVAAVRTLMPYVKQVHIKDAVPTKTPGQWGAETVVGAGAVDWKAFLGALDEGGFQGHLAIEREGGDQRVADITTAGNFVIMTLGTGE